MKNILNILSEKQQQNQSRQLRYGPTCLSIALYVCYLPARRGFYHSAEWSSLSLSGHFLSGHWSQNLCRTSAYPATTEIRQQYRFHTELRAEVIWISVLPYNNFRFTCLHVVVFASVVPGRRGVPPSLFGWGWTGGSWLPSESHLTQYWTNAWWAAGPRHTGHHVNSFRLHAYTVVAKIPFQVHTTTVCNWNAFGNINM